MPDHYAVQKGQSLLDVAGDLTHSTDKNVKQTLANALFAANPNAFYGNNPSRLKVGAVLAVPRPGESPASAAAATPASGATTAPVTGSTAAATAQGTTPAQNAAKAPAAVTAAASQPAPVQPTQATQATQTTQATPSAQAAPATAPASGATVASTLNQGASASGETTANNAASATAAMSASSSAASAAVEAASATPAQVAGASEAAAASAALAASNAHAWSGSIRPAPAVAVDASAVAVDNAAPAVAGGQNVSSLQQLLQLKNRVLAAMQAHGFGSGASAPLTASMANAASGATAVRPAAAGQVPQQGTLRGPLAVPAALAVLIVVALGIWVCLPARRRKPNAAAQDGSDGTSPTTPSTGSDRGSERDPQGDGAAARHAYAELDEDESDDESGYRADLSSSEPAATRTANTAKARLNAGPSERDLETGKLPPDDDPVFGASSRDTPFGQPPFSLEEGASGSLPTHDPQRSPFAESRTPFDTGLLLGLLEMHAHRHEVDRFQETAHELWELTDGEGPDWKRAASLGRRIDPDNPLYAEDPFAAYRQQHTASGSDFVKPMPDVDLGLPAGHDEGESPSSGIEDEDEADGEPVADRPAAGAADRAPSVPSQEDLDWLDSPSAAAHEAFQPHTAPNAARELDDATLPEARRPEHVPVAEPRNVPTPGERDVQAPSVADEIEHGTAGPGAVAGLGASSGHIPDFLAETPFEDPTSGRDALRGPEAFEPTDRAGNDPTARPLFSGDAIRASALRDMQADSVPPARAVSAGPANLGPAGFGALKLDFDLELTPNAAAPGSTPTSHDLATIARNKLDLAVEYVELGDRAGARTLLNEVLATHDPATRERAQSLLDTLK